VLQNESQLYLTDPADITESRGSGPSDLRGVDEGSMAEAGGK